MDHLQNTKKLHRFGVDWMLYKNVNKFNKYLVTKIKNVKYNT